MILRVFPRRTSFTPVDEYAFVGDPPMIRPEADEVHISCTFTWDREEAIRLLQAWAQFYPSVMLGGIAISQGYDGFIPGRYIKHGVTFTTRGCNNQCPWCLVPEREGKLRLLDRHQIIPGHIIQDNNLLQAPRWHIERVFEMLRKQRRAVSFPGGLDATLLSDRMAEELRGLSIDQVFLAADTDGSLRPLEKAIEQLSCLGRNKLRCYVLLAYEGESMEKGLARLIRVWELGAMPFAQLYQPPDRYIQYSKEWRGLARTWSRPAAMKTVMNMEVKDGNFRGTLQG